jgi:hypothetical protein
MNNMISIPTILYDYIPWGMMPMYDLGDTRIEDYEVFYDGQWLPGNYFTPKDILILRWNVSNNPEDIRKLCKTAIDLKTTNHLIAGSIRQSMFSGKILVGFQDNQLEYRASILFNRDPTWGEDFTSSTVPDWLK